MSVLLLAERGRLSLDDEVRKHIPELPDYGDRLTIRHLLTHTSGLRDPFLLMALSAPSADIADNNAVVALLTRQRSLNFHPGAESQYSNGGYPMLAVIVSRLSGQSLRAFTDANIFTPLGMRDTHVHDDPPMIIRNRATGYRVDEGTVRIAPHPDLGRLVGTTAVFSTARDLLKWQQNFVDVRVGDPTLVAEMQESAVLTSGDKTQYGFGLQLGEHAGLRTIGHGGGDPGVRAHAVRYPDHPLAVAVLCNREDVEPSALAQRVAEVYLANVMSAKTTSVEQGVTLTASQLASKAGLYRNPLNDTVGRIFVRGGRPMAADGATTSNSVALSPVSDTRFVLPGTPIVLEFTPQTKSRPPTLRIIGAMPKPELLELVTEVSPSVSELAAFSGEFDSRELGVTYRVSVRDRRLTLQIPGRPLVALQPLFADAFHAPGLVDLIRFHRDASGRITSLSVHGSGVRGVRFDRLTR